MKNDTRNKMSNNDTLDVVGVICVDKFGRVLLVQGRGGKWSFPKGRRKELETFHQGALREAKEEAGIDLKNMTIQAKIQLRYGTYYLYVFGKSGNEIELDDPMTPDEIACVAWLDTETLAHLDKNADLRVYVNERG
jgi:8-oxo-dGTP pyrophosphatase MutT (NUDIX family)